MKLAQDATARNGRVLLRKGNSISDKHIEIFKAWGVTEAEIEGVSNDDVESAGKQVDPELRKQAGKKLVERFRYMKPQHPFSKELFRICTERILADPNK